MTVLEWKFSYYDRNGNEGLSPGEQWLFQREIDSFIHCSTFFDHVTDLIDANSDDELLIYEWGDFFDGECGWQLIKGLLCYVAYS